MSHSLSHLPARLGVGSQHSSSASSSALRTPLRALMLLSPGPGASPSGFFPGPQPRRLRLRLRRLAVLAGARQRQPVPSVGAAATTQRRQAAGDSERSGSRNAAGDPGSGAPFPRSPAASAVRALLRSCAIPVECAQRRSQRPRREVCPSGVCASPPRPAAPRDSAPSPAPAAGHNTKRRRRRALALESAGRGGASRGRRRGLEGGGGATGPSEGGYPMAV